MRRELLVPKLGLTMTEGTLLEWLVKPGDRFQADQSIFIIESEKAAVEVPAEAAGVLLETTAQIGTTLTLGSVIGYWEDDARGGSTNVPAKAQAPAAAEAAPPAAPVVAPPAPVATQAAPGTRLLATPLARRLARERGIDLATVRGSGPRGRIRSGDLPAAASTQAPAPARAAGPAAPAPAVTGSLRPASATEQTIARRMVAAKQEIPHFYLSLEAEVSALQKLRADLNAAQSEQRFTVNHFIVAAVGRALAQLPEVNRVWTADGVLTLPTFDVGMAVHTERGLLAPVLRDVGRQPLSQIAREANAAAARAQAGRLGPAEMGGGAITVSNAGMHNVTYMASIINPGQSMILGVGSVRGVFRPGENDEPQLRRELGLVLSADHRVLDGVTGLQFLKLVVSALERPLSLLVA